MSRLQPVGQKRLTNICVVRYKKGGKRFEVACYKNTVIAWRNKVETDIDEVLQVHTIFANVDRGILAKRDDCLGEVGAILARRDARLGEVGAISANREDIGYGHRTRTWVAGQ